MRLAPRTTLTMLLVAGAPLALAGWSAIKLSEHALQERARELHQTVATSVAQRVDDALVSRITASQHAASNVRFEVLRAAALRGALRLVYRQIDGASAVALFDDQNQQVGVAQFLTEPQPEDPVIADRPILTDEDIAGFGRNLPLGAAREVGAATSSAYVGSDGSPRLSVAVKSPADWILAMQLSLEDLRRLVVGQRVGERGRVFVTDAKGRVILDQSAAAVASREDRSAWPAVAAALSDEEMPTVVEDPVLGRVLGAAATVPDFNWHVIVAEPEADALAAATALTQRTLIWLGVALAAAMLLGVLSARAVIKPIKTLHAGATALRAGDFEHRVAGAERGDELGEMASAFNGMAEEIQRWNRELGERVEQKTRELSEAQELLMRSQKLAAVGELGAGVAHEINNPLTAVISMTQVVKRKLPADSPFIRHLGTIEEQAFRIQEVVANLRRLTEERETRPQVPVTVTETLDAALSLVTNQLEEEKITLVREYQEGLPQVGGDEVKLTEAFLHLINNARKAMPEGGTLTTEVAVTDGKLISVRISDTGVGIAKEIQSRIFEPFFTDRKDWGAKGLGLTMVNKIAEAHDGKVTVESVVGEGSTFTILLPVRQSRSLV